MFTGIYGAQLLDDLFERLVYPGTFSCDPKPFLIESFRENTFN